jgi:hypothetical protein
VYSYLKSMNTQNNAVKFTFKKINFFIVLFSQDGV